jgi:hypothetical protein
MGQSSFGFAVERAMPDARHVKSVTYPCGCDFDAQQRENDNQGASNDTP